MNLLKSLFLLSPLIFTVSSCCKCTKDPAQPPFERRSFSLLMIDNNGVQPVLSGEDSLDAKTFGMALVFEGTKGPVVSLEDNYPLVPYYLECCTEGKRAEWGLESIRITTLHDFDEAHGAGADVTDYFRIISYSGGYLSYLKTSDVRMGLFHNSFDANGNYVLPLMLMNPPSGEKAAQFKAVVTFREQSESFEKTSSRVVLR